MNFSVPFEIEAHTMVITGKQCNSVEKFLGFDAISVSVTKTLTSLLASDFLVP